MGVSACWRVLIVNFGLTGAFKTMQGQVHISKEDQNQAVVKAASECLHRMEEEQYPDDGDVYCNTTFDNIMCWHYTPAGNTSKMPCPNYVHGFYTTGYASRKCMPDGTWFFNTDPTINMTWTNYSECLHPSPSLADRDVSKLITEHIHHIQQMKNAGYGISFVSLSLAVFIMIYYKRLHCPRNTMHINLFVSFILRAVISFLQDILIVQGLGFANDVETISADAVLFIEEGTHWQCKLLHTMFHYILSANYMWLLVEGLYLHTMIIVSVFSERGTMKWYCLLGWGFPLLSVVPWVIVRATLENILCWNTNPTPGYFWILKAPIVLSLVINFIFFLNILRALFTKLHRMNTPVARRNRYRRIAKSTLILIPLFGVHYIVFLGLPDNVNDTAEVVKLYFEMFFNSFQGFIVAILVCFLNKEVQMELRKTWYRLRSKTNPRYLQQTHYQAVSRSSRRDHRGHSFQEHRSSFKGHRENSFKGERANSFRRDSDNSFRRSRENSFRDSFSREQRQNSFRGHRENSLKRNGENCVEIPFTVENHRASSESSSADQQECLCRWTLNRDGKLRCSFSKKDSNHKPLANGEKPKSETNV